MTPTTDDDPAETEAPWALYGAGLADNECRVCGAIRWEPIHLVYVGELVECAICGNQTVRLNP